MATCDGTDCDIACDTDYRRCPGTNNCAAVAAPGCCTATDCTTGGPGTLALCNDNACSYPCNTPAFKQCGNACIPAASCCTPCTDGFTCKNGSCPTSCITDQDCVSGRHCRHGKCIAPITQLSSGALITCSLHQDLSVRCWGATFGGADGHPRVVPLPMGATHVAAGNRQACAVLSDNTVWCWDDLGGGVTAPAPQGGLTDVASINLSAEVGGCAVLRSGGVKCWGTNQNGQLGIGTVDANVSPPTTVPGLANVVEVSHGGQHVCARKSDGSVACWGQNRYGELATGAINPQTLTVEPNPVPTPTVVAAAAGALQVATNGLGSFSLNAGTSSNLLAWGSYQHAGRGDVAGGIFLVPGSVGTTRFASVSIQNASCGVTVGQTVKCWGDNLYGQAGAPPSGMYLLDPVDLPGLSGVGRVASGWDAVCATVQGDTDVVCWGNNSFGQLGNPTTPAGPTPVAVQW
jgi:alpha-tubulin suppressor-like RCC1 family protein